METVVGDDDCTSSDVTEDAGEEDGGVDQRDGHHYGERQVLRASLLQQVVLSRNVGGVHRPHSVHAPDLVRSPHLIHPSSPAPARSSNNYFEKYILEPSKKQRFYGSFYKTSLNSYTALR